MNKLILIAIVGIWNSSWAVSHLDRAYRRPGVSYTYYLERAANSIQYEELETTPLGSARYYGTSTLPNAESWESTGSLISRFYRVRDTRFIRWSRRPSFLRRSSWLYPDDGCFARASLANKNLYNWNVPVPNKVFVFGNLKVRTRNHPRGYVTWWYHVAPIIEVNNVKYVLDPAIEPDRPLPLRDWLGRMGRPESLKVAICESGTFAPRSSCSRRTTGRESESSQQHYLNLEWNRIQALGRNPESELGNSPPW